MSQLSLFPPRSSAEISPCGLYRYTLHRRWNDGPQCMFIMLNPSTADATNPDPTMTRCMNFAKLWGFGGLAIGNLFALRSPSPKDLARATDPVGPLNNASLLRLVGESTLVVAAWGNHGVYIERDAAVRALLDGVPLHYLRLTKAGQPEHPLYMPAGVAPTRWEPAP